MLVRSEAVGGRQMNPSRFVIGFVLLLLAVVFTTFTWAGLSLKAVLGLFGGYFR
jgi:hypothetical protein